VVLSAPYEEDLAKMQASAERYGAGSITYRLTDLDHFDLISDEVLSKELSDLV
jgi:hypothetical protein